MINHTYNARENSPAPFIYLLVSLNWISEGEAQAFLDEWNTGNLIEEWNALTGGNQVIEDGQEATQEEEGTTEGWDDDDDWS